MPLPTEPAAFSPSSIQTAVLAALNAPSAVPPGHKGAVLVSANNFGATVIVAAKFGDHWGITAQAQHPWSGKPEDVTGTVTIKGTW